MTKNVSNTSMFIESGTLTGIDIPAIGKTPGVSANCLHNAHLLNLTRDENR